jgi:hypothetical protein
MAGESGGAGKRKSSGALRAWRALWRATTWEPTTWAAALVQALVVGTVVVAFGLWLGAFSVEDAAFLWWWAPLWVATSLAGFAFRRRRSRRRGAAALPASGYQRPSGDR